jgi:hypothetical protein
MQRTRIVMYAEYIQTTGQEKEKEIGHGWGLFVEIDDNTCYSPNKQSKYMNKRIQYYAGNMDTIYEDDYTREVSIDIDLEDEMPTRTIYKFNVRNSFYKFIKERVLLGVSCLWTLHGYFFK